MNPVAPQQQTKIKLQRTKPNPKTEERDRQIARFLFARDITTKAGFLFSQVGYLFNFSISKKKSGWPSCRLYR